MELRRKPAPLNPLLKIPISSSQYMGGAAVTVRLPASLHPISGK
nr:hypothetical protein [Candidatus Baldrarchaeota archaeon]